MSEGDVKCLEKYVNILILTFLAEGDDCFILFCFGFLISIHTFLAEGDKYRIIAARAWVISIHTFLAEGDLTVYK